jgi:hypothetical protein
MNLRGGISTDFTDVQVLAVGSRRTSKGSVLPR